jgi:hypothetical protein
MVAIVKDEVQARTLDSFLIENNIDSIDFVHMDVQELN